MELALKYTYLKPSDIIFKDIENNKVIDNGDFIKLLYYNSAMKISLFNINIVSCKLELNTPFVSIFNSKKNNNITYLNIERNDTNNNFIEFIEKTDEFFMNKTIEYFKKKSIKYKNKTYINILKENNRDNIVFRMPVNNIGTLSNNKNNRFQIILRWNGIWVTNTQYGLNYKILKIIQKS
jgi:hypothetical protein